MALQQYILLCTQVIQKFNITFVQHWLLTTLRKDENKNDEKDQRVKVNDLLI